MSQIDFICPDPRVSSPSERFLRKPQQTLLGLSVSMMLLLAPGVGLVTVAMTRLVPRVVSAGGVTFEDVLLAGLCLWMILVYWYLRRVWKRALRHCDLEGPGGAAAEMVVSEAILAKKLAASGERTRYCRAAAHIDASLAITISNSNPLLPPEDVLKIAQAALDRANSEWPQMLEARTASLRAALAASRNLAEA